MKNLLYLILTFCVLSSCSVRYNKLSHVSYPFKADSSYIRINGFYKNQGKIIFTSTHSTRVEKDFIEKGNYIFKPSDRQIIDVETIMLGKSAKYFKNDTIAVLKHYYSYYRQYLGFVNRNGDSIIVINLINPSVYNKKSIEDNLYVVFDEKDGIIDTTSVIKRKSLTNMFYININKKDVEF